MMYFAITFGRNIIFKITFTLSEDSSQPEQIRSLIRVFLSYIRKFIGTFVQSNQGQVIFLKQYVYIIYNSYFWKRPSM